jgi:CBS domain-containing protein
MQVADLCTRQVEVIAPTTPVAEAACRMEAASVGTLVVVDELRRPLGILTDRDVVTRVVARGRSSSHTPVSAVMSDPVAWVHADRPLEAALAEMARLRVRRLAVVDERERLVGILALDDALCAVLEEGSALRAALQANL